MDEPVITPRCLLPRRPGEHHPTTRNTRPTMADHVYQPCGWVR